MSAAAPPASLAARLVASPAPLPDAQARTRLDDLLGAGDAARLGAVLAANGPADTLLVGLAAYSPFLWRLVEGDPDRCAALLDCDPDRAIAGILDRVGEAWRVAGDAETLMRDLRLARQEVALLVALADIGGAWTLEQVTAALSGFADAALGAALRFLLKETAESGHFAPPRPDDPAAASGIVVLALGKHGARELNYSSDIDIVVFFDPESAPLAGHAEPTTIFVRIVKGIVRLLQERTGDGYVFRVDLRLRPDPASTPIAIALPSAFAYYETVGQNWERAALIKARPVAGDLPLGEAFLKDLAPFIWRKYFDFAAIADIHAMKRQIHAVRGHETISVAGHDIKLGRGGIREVEFFVQTQQLVFGGRRTALRGRRTLDMLATLHEEGWISGEARDELSDAYRFLRTVEHRLQMVADEQTQRLPSDPDDLERFARFCGFGSAAAFSQVLTRHAGRVETHYARLFEEGPELTSEEGSLVFTGTSDDPETLVTLRRMGFADPAAVAETVRGWHFGRRQAVTSPRAREVLTELVPALLKAFGGSADPDGALAAFDRALGRMPAAVELFSILRSHASLLGLFADILGSAPRLAETVAARPHLLDAVIDPAFAAAEIDTDALERRVASVVGRPEQTEDMLDRLREAGQHELFLVGARVLSGALSLERAGRAYAALAEAVICVALAQVEERFAREHGRVLGGRIVVLGMGRLGSREMTATSDLDLVVLYDFDEDRPDSDGPRPLHATVYYTRLTQRLISALTVPTRRGLLYQVDMRLRPSGNKGPAATQLRSFAAYHGSESETWEHLALTRARPVAGDPAMAEEVREIIRAVLSEPADPERIRKDARDMRALIAREKGDAGAWDLKMAPGGLLDAEFIAQTLVLLHAAERPGLLVQDTAAILERAARDGLIPAADADALRTAHAELRDLFQWQRLCVAGDFDPDTLGSGLKARMAAAVGLPDWRVLEQDVEEKRARVRACFEFLV